MKKHRKLLIFLALVLLVAGYIWQSPSERNTVAILVRRQSQMEDFVQSVKAEAAQPHDVLSAPDPLWAATPEGTFCRKMDSGRRRRDRIQALAANHAFDLIRRYLTGLPL